MLLKIVLLLFLVAEVIIQKSDNGAGEQEECDQVRDCHKAVKGFGYAPEKPQICCGAYDRYQRVDQHKGAGEAGGKQKLNASRTIEAPADDGRESKAAHGDGGKDRDPGAIG